MFSTKYSKGHQLVTEPRDDVAKACQRTSPRTRARVLCVLMLVFAPPVANAAQKSDPGSGPPPASGGGSTNTPPSACGVLVDDNYGTGGARYNMLVVGDSIMWGQGLSESDKFSRLVQVALSDAMHRPVRRRVAAHSGALLSPAELSQALPVGEIPQDDPTVLSQIQCATDAPDLILINGCINDLNIRRIADPTVDAAWVERQTQSKCYGPMHGVLTAAHQRFPHSAIIVVGYYPIITENTPESAVLDLILPILGPLGSLIAAGPVVDDLASHFEAFSDAANQALHQAVSETAAETGASIVFVDPQFLPDNALNADDSLVWNVGDTDPQHAFRLAHCGGSPICTNAAWGHPNPRGARTIADRICAALPQAVTDVVAPNANCQLAERTRRLAIDLNSADPLPLHVTSTLELLARDDVTGIAVSGDVLMNGTRVGALNAPIQIVPELTSRTVRCFGNGTCMQDEVPPVLTATAPGYYPYALSVPVATPRLVPSVTPSQVVEGEALFVVHALDASTNAVVTGTVYVDGVPVGTTDASLRATLAWVRRRVPSVDSLQDDASQDDDGPHHHPPRRRIGTEETGKPPTVWVRAQGYADTIVPLIIVPSECADTQQSCTALPPPGETCSCTIGG